VITSDTTLPPSFPDTKGLGSLTIINLDELDTTSVRFSSLFRDPMATLMDGAWVQVHSRIILDRLDATLKCLLAYSASKQYTEERTGDRTWLSTTVSLSGTFVRVDLCYNDHDASDEHNFILMRQPHSLRLQAVYVGRSVIRVLMQETMRVNCP
jgi:hypothetical protein